MVQGASSPSLHPIFQLLFYPFPACATVQKQPSILSPFLLDSHSALECHSHCSSTCPFSFLSDTSWAQPSGQRSQCVLLGAAVLGKLHPSFEVRRPPTQEESGVSGKTEVSPPPGESGRFKKNQASCPLVSFLQEPTHLYRLSHFHGASLFWCKNCSISDSAFFSTISSPEINLMRFCRSIPSSPQQAWTQSCTTDSSDPKQNISAQQSFRRNSGNKWLYCLYLLSWWTPSQREISFC